MGPHFPTYITHRSKTTPDIILSNRHSFYNHFSQPGPATPSDHTPVIFLISTNPIQIPIKARTNFKKADWNKYQELLNTNEILNTNNINSQQLELQARNWTTAIQKAAEKAIPKTVHRTIPHLITNHTIRQTRIIHDTILNDIILNGPSHEKFTRLLIYRTKLIEEYREARREQWEELIRKTDTERNSRDFCSSIKRMIGNNTTTQQKYLKDHNNKRIYEDEEKEEIFRGYWSQVFKISREENDEFDQDNDHRVNQYIEENRHQIASQLQTNMNRLMEQTRLATVLELKKIINSLKQKAPGEDEITKYHLANLPNKMLINFTKIINASLSLGYYPEIWKTSIMIFIPKANKSPLQHTNYRPISLLSVPGKIVEKLVNNRLMNTLTQKKIHNEHQHGFRPERGTNTATALLYEHLAIGKANGMRMNLVLRDISRAFDKVWHYGVIYKMIKNNLPEYIVKFISSYLKDRKAKIRIGNYVGEEFRLESGVPQGGCLSPTLFNFYTHDLEPAEGQNINLIYADDITQIVANHGSEKMLERITSREIEKVNKFEKMWKIKTNSTKFQILPFGRSKLERVRVGQITHEFVDEGKVLGLIITKNGFVKHITNRINAAKVHLKNMFKFRELSWSNKRKIFYALVKSTLDYPPIPQHIASPTQMKRMQIVQNKAARIISNIDYRDRIDNETANKNAQLEPLNVSLHRQAINIWTKLDTMMSARTKLRLTITGGKQEQKLFPSSYNKALGPEPDPKY